MGNSQMVCCDAPVGGAQNKIQVIVPIKHQNLDKDLNKGHITQPQIGQPVRRSLEKHNPYADKVNNYAKLHHYGKDIFQGQLGDHGEPEGYGKMYYPNGAIFIGQFKRGIAQGDGHFVWVDGSYYHGKMANNLANDSNGVYQSDTLRYKGGIKDNHFEGYGVQQQQHSKFEGQFSQGKPKKGKLTWVQKQSKKLPLSQSQLKNDTQCVYEGEFDQNGNFSGKGLLVNSKGTYEGQFLNGMKNGKGIFIYQNKLRYEGQYKDDVKNGNGTIYSADNKIAYSGQFRDGMPHGKGWVPLPDGSPNYLQFRQGISSIIVDQKAKAE